MFIENKDVEQVTNEILELNNLDKSEGPIILKDIKSFYQQN